jgi:hypothetical protein
LATAVVIDKITNSIEDAVSGKNFETEVLPFTKNDLKTVLKKKGWKFNWRLEFKKSNRQLYKLIVIGNPVIQGLISMEVMENFIEMHLIENAPHNFEGEKEYLGVAGNLVAFACKISYEFHYGGYVAFTAKSRLIDHYSETLGAVLIFKDRMMIPPVSAKKLVNSYYKNYFDEGQETIL